MLLNAYHYKCSHHTVCYNIIDNIPYVMLFISMTYLFYNWKFVLLVFIYLAHSPTHLPSGSHRFVMCIYKYVLLCLFVLFCLDTTYK